MRATVDSGGGAREERLWWWRRMDPHSAVIHLKDIVKGGMKERFEQLRAMGIKTIMITGDNPLTAAAIARGGRRGRFSGRGQAQGQDGPDPPRTGAGRTGGDHRQWRKMSAPALAQADVGVAMNSGTQAAKEAGNMVDLDSNPTKLIEIVGIGKQLLMTRRALTAFSDCQRRGQILCDHSGDVHGGVPQLAVINIMHLQSPQSAILSAVIFNALIIVALIPLALRGVAYRPMSAAALLRGATYGFMVWAESSPHSLGSN